MSCVVYGVQRDCSGKAGCTTGLTAEQHLLKCGGGGAIVGEPHFDVAVDDAAAVLVLVLVRGIVRFLLVLGRSSTCMHSDSRFLVAAIS